MRRNTKTMNVRKCQFFGIVRMDTHACTLTNIQERWECKKNKTKKRQKNKQTKTPEIIKKRERTIKQTI